MNSIVKLMAAFSCKNRPVSVFEFQDFWNSCSPVEKKYYKNASLI